MKLGIDLELLNKITSNLKDVLIKFSNGLVEVFNKLKERTFYFIYKIAKCIVSQNNRKKSVLGSSCSRKEFLLLKKRSKRFLKEVHLIFGENPDFSNKDIFTFKRINRKGRKYSICSFIINIFRNPKNYKLKYFILGCI